MQTRLSNFQSCAARRAFSLIELMTAVSIMMVIIFALYAMFNKTQQALRANLTQVDVLEAGRATAEMLGRELEQLTACGLPQTINLFAGMMPRQVPPLTQMDLDQNPAQAPLRTNILQEFFFLSRQTNQWVGTGYRILHADEGVGTLYRMTVATNFYALTYTNLMSQFMNGTLMTNPVTGQVNFHRVTDGIIHLRLRAFDPAGREMKFDSTNMYPSYSILRVNRGGGALGAFSTALNAAEANVVLREDPYDPHRDQTQLAFSSNALPGYVELELGVIEANTLKQYEALRDSPKVADTFLKKQAGKVHLFRQRIPIRTVLQ